jgi:hypothetical protein
VEIVMERIDGIHRTISGADLVTGLDADAVGRGSFGEVVAKHDAIESRPGEGTG